MGREKKIEKKNSSNQTLSLQEKFYDPNNNLIRLISTVYNDQKIPVGNQEILYQYNEMNKLIFLLESPNTKEEKRTKYAYTKLGLLQRTTKPNGIQIINEYDAFGNNTKILSCYGAYLYP